jgi:hypothetical protein
MTSSTRSGRSLARAGRALVPALATVALALLSALAPVEPARSQAAPPGPALALAEALRLPHRAAPSSTPAPASTAAQRLAAEAARLDALLLRMDRAAEAMAAGGR